MLIVSMTIATRPNIATITNMLAQYLHCTVPGHVATAKRVLKYLIGTADLGIQISPLSTHNTNAFVKFSLPISKTIAMADENWGPQDQ